MDQLSFYYYILNVLLLFNSFLIMKWVKIKQKYAKQTNRKDIYVNVKFCP